jgi:hypothetical protein
MKFLVFVVACALTYTTQADEPWMYPVAITPSTLKEMSSLTLRKAYVETLGVRTFDGTSRTIDADVASFDDIVKWYSEKLGGTELPKALETFKQNATENPERRDGYSRSLLVHPGTLLTYRFVPAAKQVTLLHAVDGSDLVVVSLQGTEHETCIQVLRHYRDADRANPDSKREPD